eukprot:536486_1
MRYCFKPDHDVDALERKRADTDHILLKRIVEPSKSGFLFKQSKYTKVYRKRWIMLKFGKLYSFDNKIADQATEVFDLSTFDAVTSLIVNHKEAQFALKLSNSEKKIHRILTASSATERDNWILFIDQSIKLSHKLYTGIIRSFVTDKPEYNCSFQITLPGITTTITTWTDVNYSVHKALGDMYSPVEFKFISLRVGKRIINNIEWQSFACDQHFKADAVIKFSVKNLNQKDKLSNAKYNHKIKSKNITCPFIKKNADDDEDKKSNQVDNNEHSPFLCPVYKAMKNNYAYTEDNLKHIIEFTHFKHEFLEKPECRFNDNCKAYIRLEQGGNRIEDRCHLLLYRHPPRTRQLNLTRNFHPFKMNNNHESNIPLYEPDIIGQIKWNENNGYLMSLLNEVSKNGFTKDLCLSDDDYKNDNYSILSTVNNKLSCQRHKLMGNPLNRGEMLALILYTGCDCNYDLCGSQRNGDFRKWKWFDYCLWNAIKKLSDQEDGVYKLYSGLHRVKLSRKTVYSGYFITYVSATWMREISEKFANKQGMIIEIDEWFRNDPLTICCDVSWISKFPDECEVLIARSIMSDPILTHIDGPNDYFKADNFSCKIMDEKQGMQTVLISKPLNDIRRRHYSLECIDAGP